MIFGDYPVTQIWVALCYPRQYLIAQGSVQKHILRNIHLMLEIVIH